jgi:hypothetical protein
MGEQLYSDPYNGHQVGCCHEPGCCSCTCSEAFRRGEEDKYGRPTKAGDQ